MTDHRDHLYFVIVFGASLLVLFALALAVTLVEASSGVRMSPGRISAESCAQSATMPIINWSAKCRLEIVQLHQAGDCRLTGEWDASRPGLYCTGIGTLDGQDWIPDECVTVAAEKPVKREKFRNVFRYRYQ